MQYSCSKLNQYAEHSCWGVGKPRSLHSQKFLQSCWQSDLVAPGHSGYATVLSKSFLQLLTRLKLLWYINSWYVKHDINILMHGSYWHIFTVYCFHPVISPCVGCMLHQNLQHKPQPKAAICASVPHNAVGRQEQRILLSLKVDPSQLVIWKLCLWWCELRLDAMNWWTTTGEAGWLSGRLFARLVGRFSDWLSVESHKMISQMLSTAVLKPLCCCWSTIDHAELTTHGGKMPAITNLHWVLRP